MGRPTGKTRGGRGGQSVAEDGEADAPHTTSATGPGPARGGSASSDDGDGPGPAAEDIQICGWQDGEYVKRGTSFDRWAIQTADSVTFKVAGELGARNVGVPFHVPRVSPARFMSTYRMHCHFQL